MATQAENRKMYFANSKGLLEFNGEQWHLYPTPNGSIMRSVHWHDGLLYSGSYRDFGHWKPQADGTLKYTSLVKELEVPVQEDEQFWNIISNKSGILFQTLNRIYSYELDTKQVQLVLETPKLTKVFKVGNRIFYNVSEVGLYEFISGKSVMIQSSTTLDGDVIAMEYAGTSIAIISSRNSLLKLEGDDISLISSNQFEESVTVYSATRLKNGTFALGTISNGLLIINENGAVQYQMDRERGLSNNTVLSVFTDVDDNLWLALDNGIDYVEIESAFKTFIDRTGTLGTIYAALNNGMELYLGTNQGVYYKSEQSEAFRFVDGTQGQVWALEKRDGTIFCGHNLGTYILDAGEAIRIPDTEGTWDIQYIPERPELLIQGTYNGISILEKKDNVWILRNKIEGFDISSKDFAFIKNKIYVGHEYKGLYEIDIDEDFRAASKVELVQKVERGINSDVIRLGNDILYSNQEGIFLKKDGVNKFERNDQLSVLTETNGYTSGRMIKINENSFWLFTRKSLIQVLVEPINNSFETKVVLLPQNKRSEKRGYESLIRLQDDNYLLGTSQGYLLMDGNELTRSNNKLVIDRIIHSAPRVNNRLLDLKSLNSIPHGANTLEFFFYTTEFDAFSNVKYQYRLLGSDDEWSQQFDTSNLIFENLDYGMYTLEIRGIINGILLDNVASVDFNIEPPFYFSTLAIIIYVILVIIGFFLINLFYRWYYKRKKNKELEKQKQQMEIDLLQSQKDLADLKNQQLNFDIESRNRELAVTTMAMIKKNETLNELKDQLDNLPTSKESKSLKKMLDKNLNSKQDWLTFEEAFNNADKDFFKKIKELHPSLTSGDLRLCVYLRLNLSSKEIAPLLNISPRSVEIKRYRLRKKLKLSREDSLSSYIVEI